MFLISLKLKEIPYLCLLLLGWLPDGITPSPLLFLVFSFLSWQTEKCLCVYAPLVRSIPGRYICKRAASTVLDSILSSSLFHFSVLISLSQPRTHQQTTITTTTVLPSRIKPKPQSSSSVVFLVSVQVSHRTDQWGRCRCKWISSLTLAQESTKSAWRVRLYCFFKDPALKVALLQFKKQNILHSLVKTLQIIKVVTMFDLFLVSIFHHYDEMIRISYFVCVKVK